MMFIMMSTMFYCFNIIIVKCFFLFCGPQEAHPTFGDNYWGSF